MKKTFDFNRFWQVMKWTILTEKKSILTAFLAFVCAFLAIQLFSCFTIFDLTHSLGSAATMAGMITCSGLISFMSVYYASGVLGNARTGQQRIIALMLPASNVEKFFARLLYCCIIMPVVIYLAVVASTGLRMLFELLAGHEGITSGLSYVFSGPTMRFNDNELELFSTFFYVASSCWSISLFVLGGVFFHQRPFIWTAITIFAASLLLSTLTFYICYMIGEDSIKNFLMNFRGMTFETFDLLVSLLLTAFTVLNVWLSYRLYCRLQVVQHKWFNV
jgi:hypothetical protein